MSSISLFDLGVLLGIAVAAVALIPVGRWCGNEVRWCRRPHVVLCEDKHRELIGLVRAADRRRSMRTYWRSRERGGWLSHYPTTLTVPDRIWVEPVYLFSDAQRGAEFSGTIADLLQILRHCRAEWGNFHLPRQYATAPRAQQVAEKFWGSRRAHKIAPGLF